MSETKKKIVPAVGIMEILQLLSAFQVLQTPSLATGVGVGRALDLIELRLGVRPKGTDGMPKPGSALAEYTAWALQEKE